MLSDNAAQCQKHPIPIGFGQSFPEICEGNSLNRLQRARGGTALGAVCRMVILRGGPDPGESESNPPISGVPGLQLWQLEQRIDHTELQVWSVCVFCNRNKGPNLTGIDPETDQIVPLFNPRQDAHSEHFKLDGIFFIGLTPTGRATVRVLAMNSDEQLRRRSAQA